MLFVRIMSLNWIGSIIQYIELKYLYLCMSYKLGTCHASVLISESLKS